MESRDDRLKTGDGIHQYNIFRSITKYIYDPLRMF